MPPAAMHQAKMAPNGPVAMPKVLGSEKMPEPTIEPTTIAVSANSESFWIDGVPVILSPRRACGPLAWRLHHASLAGLGISGDYLVDGKDSPVCSRPSGGRRHGCLVP